MAGSSETQLTADARDARVGQVLNAYLDRRARGEDVSEQALLAEHADIADELREHLALLVELEPDDGRIESLLRQRVLSPCADGRYLAEFGAYKITGTLGRGGMGIVLKAYEESLNRTVALKLLRPDLADDSAAVQRFEREAKAAAALHHPNIVTVHAIGRERDTHYIAMEYVTGGTLADLIREHGPLDADTTRAVFRQLLEALAAAHAAGLIHRDVKSANVLVESRDQGTGNGEQGTEAARSEKASSDGATRSLFPVPRSLPLIKLADFGLARILTGQTRLTTGDGIMGTPEYMSPEQARGDEDIDHRTDLYSAGVVLYEMLTGHTPFRAATPSATIRRILDEEPADPRNLRSAPDERLSNLAQRLLAKRADDRMQEASDIADALDTDSRIARPARRRRRLRQLGAFAAVALSVVATAIVLRELGRRAPPDITHVEVDDSGRFVRAWRADDPTPFMFYTAASPVYVWDVIRFTADGNSQLIAVALAGARDGRGLLAFHQDARPAWRLPLHDGWPVGVRGREPGTIDTVLAEQDGQPSDVIAAMAFDAIDIELIELDGLPGDELVVAGADNLTEASCVALVDPRGRGSILKSFWHLGRVQHVRVCEGFFGSEHPAVVACGLNQGHRTGPDPDHASAPYTSAVMVLDPSTMDGVCPVHSQFPEDVKRARVHAYAYLDMPATTTSGSFPGSAGGSRRRPSVGECAQVRDVTLVPPTVSDGSGASFRVSVTTESSGVREGGADLLLDRDLQIVDVDVADCELHGRTDPQFWIKRWRVIPMAEEAAGK